MKRMILAIALFVSSIYLVPVSSAAALCNELNVPTLAEDGTTVTMTSINLVEKTGSIQLTIGYKLLNATSDKKINEGSFKIFFEDGTSTPQYGFFGSLFPSDSLIRSHTWEFLKSLTPTVISYNADFFAKSPTSNTLNWAIPGKSCQLVSAADKAAADKAAADKAAAEKAAAEKAAADKAAAEKAAAEAFDAAAAAIDAANAATDAANAAAEKADAKVAADLEASDREREAAVNISNQIKAELNDISTKLLFALDELLTKATSSSNKKEIASLQTQVKRVIYQFNEGQLFRGQLVEMYKKDLEGINARYIKLKGTVGAKTTITCVKGKQIKKVTAVKPVCPSGYKKK